MANIIYSQMDGSRDALFGKYEHKIKGFIEHESNLCEKERNVLTELFNVEKSNSYSEAFTGETDFDTFQSMGEGQSAENDSVIETFRKHFVHHQFGKSFTITRQMADDAKLGMGAEMKSRPRAFARAFYKTRVDAACQALIHGTESHMVFNKANIDLTTGDTKPLFHGAHPYADPKFKKKTQSNFFYTGAQDFAEPYAIESVLAAASNRMRNFKDENDNTMGYIADTIILPSNRPVFEMMVKKAVGSERTVASSYNDINTQYGNWSVVVLNNWQTTDDRFMIMSSAANRTLLGNLFFNRVELDVTSFVDPGSRNYIWNGYCRFGLGFRTWKHMSLCVCGGEVEGATSLI